MQTVLGMPEIVLVEIKIEISQTKPNIFSFCVKNTKYVECILSIKQLKH